MNFRLALQFANCLLDLTGQKTYPCDPEENVSKCLENVDPNAWTSYSNFYTHTTFVTSSNLNSGKS